MEQEQVTAPEPLLPALARALGEWFPEVEGRAIAVSEVDFFDDRSNLPSLPLVATALVTEQGQQGQHGGNINLRDDVLIQFFFEPEKYKRADGRDTPFYAFYNYEVIRDKLLTRLQQWRTPRNGSLSYQTMDVESDERAVIITFRFLTTEKWCPVSPAQEALEVTISACVLEPEAKVCCEEEEPQKDDY